MVHKTELIHKTDTESRRRKQTDQVPRGKVEGGINWEIGIGNTQAAAAWQATPHPRPGAVAKRSYPMSKVRSSGQEELPHIQGQERWPRGATPCPRSGAAAKWSYPMSKVRSSGQETVPCNQGKSSGCALLEQP